MVEHVLGERLSLCVGQVAAQPPCVEARLVHTDKTDGREVVVERAEISLGVGVKSLVEKLGNNGALYLERTGCNVHHVVKAAVEIGLVFGKIADTGHIYGNDTDRTGAFARAEEAAGFFAQLAQVKAQTAAHRTHV